MVDHWLGWGRCLWLHTSLSFKTVRRLPWERTNSSFLSHFRSCLQNTQLAGTLFPIFFSDILALLWTGAPGSHPREGAIPMEWLGPTPYLGRPTPSQSRHPSVCLLRSWLHKEEELSEILLEYFNGNAWCLLPELIIKHLLNLSLDLEISSHLHSLALAHYSEWSFGLGSWLQMLFNL